jgi:hypothetical protein
MSPMKTAVLALALLFLLPVGAALAQQEQPLRYQFANDYTETMAGTSGQACDMTTEAPKGLALPKLTGKQPFFARWKTPLARDGFAWIVLDQSKSIGVHDLLYVDTNCDGNLADEKVFKATSVNLGSPPSKNEYIDYGPVEMTLKGEKGPQTHHLFFSLQTYDDRAQLRIESACWRSGKVTMGDKKYHCRLFDSHATGIFNLVMTADPEECGQIDIDPYRDGRFERFCLGKFLQPVPTGPYYTCRVARDGSSITLTPATDVTLGTVHPSQEVTLLELIGENGHFRRRSADGTLTVPVGTYHIQRTEIQRTDQAGVPWRLDASSKLAVEVKQDKAAELEFGEPLISSLGIERTDAGIFGIQHNLAARNLENVSLMRDGVRGPAPKVRIRNDDGSYDQVFSFAYG